MSLKWLFIQKVLPYKVAGIFKKFFILLNDKNCLKSKNMIFKSLKLMNFDGKKSKTNI